MPLSREQKGKVVEELADKLSRRKAAFFVSFAGVDVKTCEELRKSLRAASGEYKVAKKTLLERALQETHTSLPSEVLAGQVGIVFDYASEVNAAKILAAIGKKSSITILGGMVDSVVLSVDEVKELALLPDLNTMRARLAGILSAPLSGLARALISIQLQFINTLRAIASKKSLGASANL